MCTRPFNVKVLYNGIVKPAPVRKQSFACIVGKPAENDVKLGALKLKPNTKIMMMGTREESLVNVYFLLLFVRLKIL